MDFIQIYKYYHGIVIILNDEIGWKPTAFSLHICYKRSFFESTLLYRNESVTLLCLRNHRFVYHSSDCYSVTERTCVSSRTGGDYSVDQTKIVREGSIITFCLSFFSVGRLKVK